MMSKSDTSCALCEQSKAVCKYAGCTGATVHAVWDPFCSQLCAALWAVAKTQANRREEDL